MREFFCRISLPDMARYRRRRWHGFDYQLAAPDARCKPGVCVGRARVSCFGDDRLHDCGSRHMKFANKKGAMRSTTISSFRVRLGSLS